MIDLQIERFLNTNDAFKMNGKIYRLMYECDKDHFHCMSTDKYNYPQPMIVAKNDIPRSMQPYEFRIVNPEVFEPGRVIFAYHKKPDSISIIHGIIVKCTRSMISFTFRDNGGEIKSVGLTARQIATDGIVVQMYPDPKII